MFHTHTPLTPRGPTAQLLRPAVPRGSATFPLSCLCVIELRVRFLGTRTKIHAADLGRSLVAPGIEHTIIPSVHHSRFAGSASEGT